MTYIDINTDREPGRFPRIAAACLIAAAAVLAAGMLSLSEDTNAEAAQQTLYLIPGYTNCFEVSGTIGTSEAAYVTAEFTDSTDVLEIYGEEVIYPDHGNYTYPFSVEFIGGTIVPGTEYTLKITISDDMNDPVSHTFTLKILEPEFGTPGGPFHVIRNNSSTVQIPLTGEPSASSLPAEYTIEYKLYWGVNEATVQYSGGTLTLPDMEPGSHSCVLKLILGGNIGGSLQTKEYPTSSFTVNVQDQPHAADITESFAAEPGEAFSAALDLKDTKVDGTWSVTKGTQEVASLPYTGEAVEFSIPSLTAEDDGVYDVKFVADGGAESVVSQIAVHVYSTVSTGFVTLDGVSGSNILEASVQTLKTHMTVTSESAIRLVVVGPAESDVSSEFFISENRLCLNSQVQEETYKLRFFDDTQYRITEQTVTLKYVDAPTIDSIRPVSGFTVD